MLGGLFGAAAVIIALLLIMWAVSELMEMPK